VDIRLTAKADSPAEADVMIASLENPFVNASVRTSLAKMAQPFMTT